MTGDWFGHGPAMRGAGVDLRLEWTQFYQGMTRGSGSHDWKDGSKVDALARIDLSRWGLWSGLSVTVQGAWNFGNSLNGYGGTAIPVNAALYFPGIEGSEGYDVTALFFTQNFGNIASLSVGKLNFIEFTRATPLRGGGGVDTFWNVNVATPVTGYSPPEVYGAVLRFNTQPVSYTFTVFDAQDAANKKLFSGLFDEGVNVMAQAVYTTRIAGLTGHYGIRGIYSTKERPDLNQVLFPVAGLTPAKKNGGWFVSLSMQQFLVQDAADPRRGWGVFAEVGKSDGNPNTLDWSFHGGIGGSGLLPGRPDDRFGIAYFRYGTSDSLINGLAPLVRVGSESGIEAFYNIAVTPWLRVSTNIQYVRPAQADFPHGVFAGVSTYVRF